MSIINYHNTSLSQREMDSMYNCYFYSESDHVLEYTINFDYNKEKSSL